MKLAGMNIVIEETRMTPEQYSDCVNAMAHRISEKYFETKMKQEAKIAKYRKEREEVK